MKIIIAGIGPGSKDDITPAVLKAIKECDVIVGYKYYFNFISDYLTPDKICIDSGMRKEKDRAKQAFDYALEGKSVCVISSGDAGIYGMAPLIWEMADEMNIKELDMEVLPGISAFQKAASLLGAPIGHDLCIISLSDLMTPWQTIEKRIVSAAYADFVTAVYNPRSKGRYWQIHRLKDLFLKERSASTPVGYVRQAGRCDQKIVLTTLGEFNPNDVDMFTVILIGNSQSFVSMDKFITPRGYYAKESCDSNSIGQSIMIKSFKTIEENLLNCNISLSKKWALLHAIHTTADFEMEKLLYLDDGAMEKIYDSFCKPSDSEDVDKTIITDVTMALSGIRGAALERLGIKAKCYLSDERTICMAKELGITRAQAGIRLAVMEHPKALYVFGNAPTALMELCSLINSLKANPLGVIAAPVGFVNVKESKYMIKSFDNIPKIIVEGRRGGSGLAATLVNSILSLNDAQYLRPGRDL